MATAAVKQPKNKKTFVKRGDTQDIVKVVLEVIKEADVSDVRAWVRQNFTRDYKGLSKLWHWVKKEVKYKEDPYGNQLVKYPSRTYAERREGTDCKSFTVFICKCLEALNIGYTVRFISQTGSRIPGHVYCIANLGSRKVIMDAVFTDFDKEPDYKFKIDYSMTNIYKLAGIEGTGTNNEVKVQKALHRLQRITAFIPDEILQDDITTMSQGQLLRHIAKPLMGKASKQKLSKFLLRTAGLKTKAFRSPSVKFTEYESVSGLRDFVKKIGSKIKETWRKLVNWIFKNVVEKAAIYFLYLFSDVNTPKINAKRAVQQKVFNAIADFSNCDPAMLMGAIEAKLTKRFGMPPKQYLQNIAIKGDAVGCADGVTTIACIAGAISALIPMIKKILDYLNQATEEKTKLSNMISKIKGNGPNEQELAAEAKAAAKTTTGESGSGGGSGKSDNTALVVGGAAVALLLLMK